MKKEYKKPRTRTLALETSYGVMEDGSISFGGPTSESEHPIEAYSKPNDFAAAWDEEEEEETTLTPHPQPSLLN